MRPARMDDPDSGEKRNCPTTRAAAMPDGARVCAPCKGRWRVAKDGGGGRQRSISLSCEPNFTPATWQAVWIYFRFKAVPLLVANHQPFPRLRDAVCTNFGLV